jgi:hypothetical protein
VIAGGNAGGAEVANWTEPIPAIVGRISAMKRAMHWGVARLMRWRISSIRASGGRRSAKVLAVASVVNGSIKDPLIQGLVYPTTPNKHPQSNPFLNPCRLNPGDTRGIGPAVEAKVVDSGNKDSGHAKSCG